MPIKQKKDNRDRWQKLVKYYLFFVLIVFFRITYLQLICHKQFLQRSKKNYMRTIQLCSQRGDIVDCNGIILATTQKQYDLYWYGSGNHDLTNNQYNELVQLCSFLELSIPEQQILIGKVINTEKYKKKICLAQNISKNQHHIIKTTCQQHKNIFIKTTYHRHYPFGSTACHFLGYTQKRSKSHGISGIEKMYQKNLNGKDGIALSVINARGITLAQKTITPEQSGETIKTTLDITLQEMAETAFNTNHNGAFIIIDPQTGAIKALVSRPSFDPAIFLQPISHKKWQSLQQNQPFLNRTYNASYPPGSLFKLVIVAAALEFNIINYASKFSCNGSFLFGKRYYHCNRHSGHGNIDLMHAIAYSCNIPFYSVGTKLSIDYIANYAYRFGLGEKTNVKLQEQKGIIPSSLWKEQTKGEPWWQGETLSVAIGQSFLLVTPLQVACMIGSIFSGYRCKPRLFIDEPIEKQIININNKTLVYLQKAMSAVARYGTGRLVGAIKNITVFAKTGTAQTTTYKNAIKKNNEHGWFTCYVTRKKENPLVMVILAENAGSSRIATRIAHNFLTKYAQI